MKSKQRAIAMAAAAALLCQGGTCCAQPWREAAPPRLAAVELDEADNATRTHLENADKFLANGQWDEAVEALRGVMENGGDKVILLQQGSGPGDVDLKRYVTVRQYCQMRLVALHDTAPEALKLYRSRADSLALQRYEQAVASRDEALLERLIDESFASSYGDDALWRLGEIALEQGLYSRARECWERISPSLRTPSPTPSWLNAASGMPLWLALRGVDLDKRWSEIQQLLRHAQASPSWLAYPDTDLDLADVRARLTLVSILERSPERAELELELLRRLHPDHEMRVGGRSGRCVDLLAQVLEQSREWPADAAPPDWPTFGGSAARWKIAQDEVEPGGEPIWEVELPRPTSPNELLGSNRLRVAEAADGLLSYHPLAVDGMALVCTGPRIDDIIAVKLATGEPAWPSHSVGEGSLGQVPWLGQRHVGVARYTMSADGQKLYARLGAPITCGSESGGLFPAPPSCITGLDLDAQLKLLFDPIQLDGPEWGPGWAFEGPPLCDGGRLYVALRRCQVSVRAHVACFDGQTGRLLWRQVICRSSAPGGGEPELTHGLLTLSQGTLYYNTNLGAIAALRPRDGAVKWIVCYRGELADSDDPDRDDRYLFRDLNPCFVEKDLVIAAPADCGRIFALDGAVGNLVWASDPERFADAVHLLGVGAGNLIVSGDRLYWLDAYSGRCVGQFPQSSPFFLGQAQSSPRGYGRGLLAGRHVYWPTRQEILVFEQQTRKTPGGWRPIGARRIELTHRGATGGNLVMADGVLLIASADRLYAFNQYGRRTPSRAQRAAHGAARTGLTAAAAPAAADISDLP